jgi:hypothetical protein
MHGGLVLEKEASKGQQKVDLFDKAYFKASLRFLPALNAGSLLALI